MPAPPHPGPRSTRAAADPLVAGHLALAGRAAAIVHPRVRAHVALDELIALGNAGLAEAARRFDPGRGVAFPTYAWYRVLGAVLDGVRRAAPLPRGAWHRLVALRMAADARPADRGPMSEPTLRPTSEPASSPACEARPARRSPAARPAVSETRTIYLTSLEAMRDRGFDAAAEAPSPLDCLDDARRERRLHAALGALPDRQRRLVTKHYWEGKSLVAAAAELGVSKSWASRLHAQAVDRLRAAVTRDE